jgi:DNA-binding Lrp family transcriptional regulator
MNNEAKKQSVLRPLDVAVALRLSREPGSTFEAIADDLAMSVSVAHGAVARLRSAGLVQRERRQVNRHALLEFLEHGVRYAFPAARGGSARGVPTAHSAPVLAGQLVAGDVVVWPSAAGRILGESLTPLYDRAPLLAEKSPAEYDMLALVDAVRIGGARERSLALDALRQRLYDRAA